MEKIRWAIFVSGRGSNLKNVLDLEASGALKKQSVVLVCADRDCPALEWASHHQKAQFVLSPKEESFSQKLLDRLDQEKVSAAFLLGYMRILPADFISSWRRPLINLHPSLLPAHKGLQAIRKAFEAGDSEMGVSLHEVVAELDSGPLIRQRRLKREAHWALEDAEREIHRLEHEMVRDYFFDLEAGEPLR